MISSALHTQFSINTSSDADLLNIRFIHLFQIFLADIPKYNVKCVLTSVYDQSAPLAKIIIYESYETSVCAVAPPVGHLFNDDDAVCELLALQERVHTVEEDTKMLLAVTEWHDDDDALPSGAVGWLPSAADSQLQVAQLHLSNLRRRERHVLMAP